MNLLRCAALVIIIAGSVVLPWAGSVLMFDPVPHTGCF
jgi:hypothetical protein